MRFRRSNEHSDMTKDDGVSMMKACVYGLAVILAMVAVTILSFEVLKNVVHTAWGMAF